ncbi:MAG: AsmA-like C-terminal region-containing protein, partial [Alphaproteobacteria bacterium]
KPDKDGAFEGTLHVEAGDPVKFARSLFGGAQGTDGLPTALAQRVTLDTSVALSAERVSLAEISMAHGDSHAKGTIEASFGKTPRLDAKLAVDRLDFDALLASPQAPKSKDAKAKGGAAKTATSKDRSKPGGKEPAKIAKDAQAGAGFDIPKDIAGGVDLSIESLVYNGGEVTKAQLVGTLGQGTFTVTKAAASLPGATAMSASASLTARKGATALDGTLNLASDDARALLDWLKVDLTGLPEDRLKKFNFAGRFSAAGEQIQLRDMNFAFDQSRLTGAATIALRKRLAFGANITLDRIDLDRYTVAAKPKVGSGETAGGETAGVSQPANPEAKTPSPLAALAPLEGFDANVQARIGQLGVRKIQAQGVALDGTLSGGTLTLRDLSAQDFAGATLRMSGTLSGFSAAPQIKANLDIRSADAARLLRAFGANSAGADKVGRLALVGSVNTNAKDANLDLALQLAGGTLRLQGPVKSLDADPRFELNMNADFPDAAALMRAFGSSSAARLGGLKLAGKGQGDAASVSFTGLKGNLGPIAINSGEAKLGLGGNKTKIMANLSTGEIALDAFGGASASSPSRAAASGRAGAPGAGGTTAAASGAQRWSRDPLDLASLKSFDGEFRLQSTAVRSGKLAVTNAALEATVLDGTLEVKTFTGRLFDGTLSVKGKVQSSPNMEFVFALDQFDVNQALRTLTELDRATGKANLRFNLRATPRTEYDLVSTLAGNGTLDGVLAVKLRAEEAAGAALLGALGQQLGQLQGISGLTNGLLMAFGSGQGQLKGSFLAERGVVRTNDLQLTNPNATTRVTGQADLPQWLVDGQGTVNTGAATQPVFTVSAKGSLDQPALKFGGTGIQGGANPLQQLLPGLLGKPQQQQPQDPQQKKKVTPQDVLKNILKP